MPRKKTVKRHQVETFEENLDSPVHQLVRAYIMEGLACEEELQKHQYRVIVYKMRNNRPQRITGHTFDTVINIVESVAESYGPGRYKLYITVMNEQGEREAFLKLEDLEIAGDMEAPAAVEHEEGGSVREQMMALQMQMMQNQQASMVEMFKVFAAMKTGGGANIGQLMTALKTGIALGSGQEVGEDDKDDSGELDVMKLLNNPIVQELGKKFIAGDNSTAIVTKETAPDS